MVALLTQSSKLPLLRKPDKERKAASALNILFKEKIKTNERIIQCSSGDGPKADRRS